MKTLILKILENIRCNRFIYYWLPAILCAGFIFYLSSLSHPNPPSFKNSDKVYHVITYSTLSFLFVRACQSQSALRTIILGLAACFLYGVSDEIHQIFVPPRTPDIFDVMADTVGGIVGAISFLTLKYVTRKIRHGNPDSHHQKMETL